MPTGRADQNARHATAANFLITRRRAQRLRQVQARRRVTKLYVSEHEAMPEIVN